MGRDLPAGTALPRLTLRPAAGGRAAAILEPVASPAHGFEARRVERQGGRVTRPERRGRRHGGTRPEKMTEKVIELDGDAEPTHGRGRDVLNEDGVLDAPALLARHRSAPLLKDNYRVARLGGHGEREGGKEEGGDP